MPNSTTSAIRQRVYLGSEDEIAFAEPVDFVRPDCHFHLAPGKADVRMMTLLFSQLADSVGEGERLAKIFEREVLFQMMFVDDFPADSKFLRNSASASPFRGGTPPLHGTQSFSANSLMTASS
jgi:hypothetical protein